VVFVSILVHEFGHAVAFRCFGADADIVLYAFGGLAIPTMGISGRWRRMAVSLAGPFAGFVLCGIVYGSNLALNWVPKGREPGANEVRFLYAVLIVVNLYWGILNLLPIFPLDGGHVSRELCGKVWGSRGRRISLKISFVLALVLVAYALLCEMDRRGMGAGVTHELPWWFPRGGFFTAILFGMLAYSSYQLLQLPDWTEDHWDDNRPPWAR
jgi:Zn-dependent protease